MTRPHLVDDTRLCDGPGRTYTCIECGATHTSPDHVCPADSPRTYGPARYLPAPGQDASGPYGPRHHAPYLRAALNRIAPTLRVTYTPDADTAALARVRHLADAIERGDYGKTWRAFNVHGAIRAAITGQGAKR